ncbi:MAG: hypothetical protein JWO06_2320 [Bacteroidota bacterium]|nr:hypothetical protein [Bacteroidota bacterium]
MQLPDSVRKILNEPLNQIAFLLFLFQAVFVSAHCDQYDQKAFNAICDFIFEHGIGNAYKCTVFNYPPLICYPLYLFGKLQGNIQNIDRYFYLFKLFALLFDYIGALIMVVLVGNSKNKIFLLLFMVLNPAFIYNSYCWGQVDSVLSCLVLLSFVSLYREKLLWAVLFFVLAINFKVQAIVFFPPLLLMGLYKFWGKLKARDVLGALLTALLAEVIIVVPFLITGETGSVVKAFAGSVDFFPVTDISASNLWFLLFGEQAIKTSDQLQWMFITYKHWGLLIFATTSFFALYPLFAAWLSKVFRRKEIMIDLNNILGAFAIIPLVFFFFNTQMHERYCHPAFFFIAPFAFATRRYFLFVLMCIAYFGSMERVVDFFYFPNDGILIFNQRFMAIEYFSTIILLFYFLYRDFLKLQMKKTYERQTS